MTRDRMIKGLYNVTNPKTQQEQVLKYLLKNKKITSWKAIETFRITRLSAVIFNLRCNFDIESKDTRVGKKIFTTYILHYDK